MEISVVIPCYGSEAALPNLVERLRKVMPTHSERYEIILVVDDPPDETWKVAQSLAQTFPETRAIQLARNYGQQNAYFAGVRAARFDVIITMDDDGQHPPEQIGVALAALTDDVDLVYAIPSKEEHGYFRSLASRSVKNLMARGLGIKHAPWISSFRIFRTFLRKGFEHLKGSHGMLDVALSWATTRIRPVRVDMVKNNGNSGYTFRSLVRHAANLLLGYSTKPLRFVTYLGALCATFGLGLLSYTVVDYALNPDGRVAGWASLATIVALFCGAQMIALGILGEYMGRLFTANLGKPPYLIRQRVEHSLDRRPSTLNSHLT